MSVMRWQLSTTTSARLGSLLPTPAAPNTRSSYAGTAWSGPLGHVRVLRRLSGAVACGPQRWGDTVVRGTMLSGELLDEQ